MERIRVEVTNKELKARATFWLTPQQNQEYLRLIEIGLPDLDAIIESSKRFPDDYEGTNSSTKEAKPPKAIYYCPIAPLTTMELDYVPTFLTKDMMEAEVKRLIELAVEAGDNPIHQAQDLIPFLEQPIYIEEVLPYLMESDPMVELLQACREQKMQIADEDMIADYQEKTFLDLLLGLMYLAAS